MKTLLAMFLVSAAVAVGATLEELQTSFMARYDEVNSKRNEQLKKVDTSYLGALERHLDKMTSGGNLDKVIPVRDEIQSVRADSGALPELTKSADRELKAMRAKFVGARGKIVGTHAESLVKLAEKMDVALVTKETELTKAGKIDEALSAKRMRETLAQDTGVAAAKALFSKELKVVGKDEWIPLMQADWEIQESGAYWVGDLTGSKGKGSYDANMPIVVERELRASGASHFISTTPAKVMFTFARPVTQLSGKLWIYEKGQAIVHFRSGTNLLKSFEMGGKGKQSEVLNLEFPPTKRLLLEFDPDGSNAGDWIVLVAPKVN